MAPTGRLNPRENLFRSAIASIAALADGPGGSATRSMQQLWPGDQVSPLLLRAATGPAMLGTDSWAGSLASTAVSDFVANLGPTSAASALIRSSLQVTISGGGITIPTILAGPDLARFVAEGQPIPVASLGIGGPLLEPHKIAGICTLTRETAQSSAAEALIRAMLTESAALALDAAMLSDAAASAFSPAGLLAEAAVITPAAGGGVDAMVDDLSALAASVAGVAGSAISFVAAPGEAVKIALRSTRELPYALLTSSALPAGTAVAIALPALVTATSPTPRIEAGSHAVVHMESESPLPIASGAQGAGVLASPSRSLWQTDTLGLNLVFEASWMLRGSPAAAVAVVSSVTW